MAFSSSSSSSSSSSAAFEDARNTAAATQPPADASALQTQPDPPASPRLQLWVRRTHVARFAATPHRPACARVQLVGRGFYRTWLWLPVWRTHVESRFLALATDPATGVVLASESDNALIKRAKALSAHRWH